MSTPKVYDYINSLIDMLDESEKFKQCDFSILCDRYPIPCGKAAYKSKVIVGGCMTIKFWCISIGCIPNCCCIGSVCSLLKGWCITRNWCFAFSGSPFACKDLNHNSKFWIMQAYS